jgi:acetyl-CoA acetyltransferase
LGGRSNASISRRKSRIRAPLRTRLAIPPRVRERSAVAAPLKEGAFDIGGRRAVSASGGLISMGHPIGPTGVGQIGEITRQLRGEAGGRLQPGARTGLAHMVGVGAVCYVRVLRRT